MALSVNCHEEEKFQSSSCPRKSSLVAGGPHVRSELSDPSSSHEGPLPRRRHMPPPNPSHPLAHHCSPLGLELILESVARKVCPCTGDREGVTEMGCV